MPCRMCCCTRRCISPTCRCTSSRPLSWNKQGYQSDLWGIILTSIYGRVCGLRWGGPQSALADRMKARTQSKPLSKNPNLLKWVAKMADLTKPALIHWVDGSQQEYDALCEQLVAGG